MSAERCLWCASVIASAACGACRVIADPPSTIPFPKGAIGCARCAGEPLGRTLVADGVDVHVCRTCRGAFVGRAAWTALFDAIARDQPVAIGSFVPLPPGRERSLLPIVRCPLCTREMARGRFAGDSDVVIDVCGADGVWLDAAELPSIVTVFQRAGAPLDDEAELLERIARVRAEAVRLASGPVACESPPSRRRPRDSYDRYLAESADAEHRRRLDVALAELHELVAELAELRRRNKPRAPYR